ncbi:MAG: Malic enzyme, NAD binding domain protein [Parcubacteria group bacterium GW2011_GWC1_42_11]|uniref:Malic enzyme, NAD binding domain protein n=1 Tax=Candidatus Nomurabacteria bacterium GW2011_GWC2_42_20 TaxID=1618756 RepID=A0A0G0ZH44_9BACT|nr:MAG: Malic enzyme, NAD binding domain protein [Parcubacteria group bacterium GW2011_GWC1_42_11]KKS48070.1 MAG: Malic enzyme, NAD binding domain protein [Candidatus Nomurabacteria bacterium GW2011_GWC2_42_20]KKS59292.1 MAG: Malic enzyme, NAD binding domain protein [Candidatus Nomurabacteria bacterium GW2011_GWA2_42_41]KKT09610.1 MAG: Malic enzyme, NAD binding domain protein [Candidatus Nomurabacteria bacterium GW2011_GWB1_43_20]TAN36478.1 MAG: NADP-dependent malic enzyme [Patescibacteria grou
MDDVYKQSLELHKEHRGKIEVISKVPLTNRAELSLAYTPGVAEVSREIGRDVELAYEYTIKGNTIAIVSDGSAILGLGNLGAHAAIPVMEGKAAIFKEFAGIDAFPICVNTQDVEEIIALVKNIAPVFGGINLEDISAPRCFEIEERLRAELPIPVMHDDQHGTATVVLAGLINSLKLRGTEKEDAKVVMSGAGAAGTAITKILLAYGFKHFIVCDTQGAIYDGREGLNEEKQALARVTNRDKKTGTLAEVLHGADIFIGVSKPGLLTAEMVRTMAEKPIIFALANPIPEIMPDVAKEAGAFVVATGRSDFPNQINNSLAFPGIFRGALDNRIKQFNEEMFISAAEALSRYVADPKPDQVLPAQFDKGLVDVVKRVIYD